jgi:hypothetical protein
MKKLPLIVLFIANLGLLAQGNTGAITGRILGMDGLPAAGVRVAIASPDANGKIASDILAGITTTDESGHYHIENIPPGRYGVVAGAVATPTFYPGTSNASVAGLVSVERGSTKAGMDFALATPSAPQPGSQNTVTPAMLAQAIAQLNQQLALPGQVITGRVVVDGPLVSTFLPNLRVTFSRIVGASTATVLPGGGWMSNRGNVLYSVSTNVKLDGSFKMELKPLPYRISVGRADGKRLDGFAVKSIALGSTDITKQELNVNGAVSGEIVITLQSIPLAGPIKL